MRRRLWLTLACSVALQVIAVSPAHAWWEYIEALSGPKLRGPHIEWRLVCYMEQRRQEDRELLERYAPDVEDGQAEQQDEQQDGALKAMNVMYGLKSPCIWKIHNQQDYRRLWSIDFGARWHWDNNFQPANKHRVNFIALTPVFTWYPESRPTRDVIDLSAGVGWYRFVSNGFPSFSGYFYDVRADVHVPTVIRRMSKWTVLIPTWRFGLMTFPSGFDANAFADTEAGLKSKVMEDWEKASYVGFFFDLDALVR